MPRPPTGNPPGRPASDNPRRHVIAVRLTDDEHTEAIALTDTTGQKISDALRSHGLKGWRAAAAKAARQAAQPLPTPPEPPQAP